MTCLLGNLPGLFIDGGTLARCGHLSVQIINCHAVCPHCIDYRNEVASQFKSGNSKGPDGHWEQTTCLWVTDIKSFSGFDISHPADCFSKLPKPPSGQIALKNVLFKRRITINRVWAFIGAIWS